MELLHRYNEARKRMEFWVDATTVTANPEKATLFTPDNRPDVLTGLLHSDWGYADYDEYFPED